MKWLWQDSIIIIGFLLYFGAGFATNYVISTISLFTTTAIEAESNPIMRKALDLGYGIWVTQTLAVSFLGSVYMLIRRKYARQKTEINGVLLTMFTVAIFLLFLSNFLNDLPIALKLLMEVKA